jgi:AcrR family transcriptional regulator
MKAVMNMIKVSGRSRAAIRTLPRKERERNSRRQDILQAARLLFVLKGYHNTTLEEIARHAEFGKGTIYNYFRSKEELFIGIINNLAAEMVELAGDSIRKTSGGAREKFTAYAAASVSYLCNNSDLYQVVMREIHRFEAVEHDSRFKVIKAGVKKVWSILAVPLAAEMKSGMLKKYDPLKLASLFDSMIRFYHFRVSRRGRTWKSDDLDEVVQLIVSVFFDGLSVNRKKKRVQQ